VYFSIKTLQKVIGKSPVQNQRDLFKPLLTGFIDTSHKLILLAKKINWSYFEKEFSKFYAHTIYGGYTFAKAPFAWVKII